jgi:ATP-dependent RNA helicase DeaD
MVETKFEELKISPELMRVIKELGFSEMFPIQAQTISKLLAGKDIIGQAQTGTGKTIAFAIPIIERVNPNVPFVQAIILVPTRELAVQVNDEIRKFSKYKRVNTLAVYGGVSIEKQIEILRRGVQVVVGTPGRVIDHLERRTLRLDNVQIVVLDEADRMLDMGFVDDIRTILETVPKHRQMMLFSATMPDSIQYLARDYMTEHEVVAVSKDELTVKDTEQVYCEVDYYNKIDTLKKVLEEDKVESAIIFCNTKMGADKLAYVLHKMRYPAEAIHGNLSQMRRNKVMEEFKSGKVRLLIATDVAARGLDIKGVSHVINYNVPQDPKNYVHRIGRTGRAGHPGKAITFVTEKEREFLDGIEWYVNMKLKKVVYQLPPRTEQKYEPREEHRHEQRNYRGGRSQQYHQSSRGPDRYALGKF